MEIIYLVILFCLGIFLILEDHTITDNKIRLNTLKHDYDILKAQLYKLSKDFEEITSKKEI